MSLPPEGSRRRCSPSPPPRRPRTRHEVVVERVVKEATGSVVYPTLTRTNYTEWALVMKVNLQAQGLWAAIDPGQADEQADRLALSAILRAVPQDMWARLAVKATAKEAWDAIRVVRVGVERVRQANAEQLRQEFSDIEFKEGESIDDFTNRISGLASSLRTLGDNISEGEVVKKLLQVVPDRYMQVAISIETLLDVSSLSLEEVSGRIRAVEQRYTRATGVREKGGRLYLTEEAWNARQRKREQEGSFSIGGVQQWLLHSRQGAGRIRQGRRPRQKRCKVPWRGAQGHEAGQV